MMKTDEFAIAAEKFKSAVEKKEYHNGELKTYLRKMAYELETDSNIINAKTRLLRDCVGVFVDILVLLEKESS